MDFDLIEKPNEKKKMVWSFKIDYNEAKTYRKEREGMLRPNQWEDLIVRVYIWGIWKIHKGRKITTQDKLFTCVV